MTIIRDGLQSSTIDIPLTTPILSLDFANSKRLDPRITFTRASRGTYVDSDGYIKTVEVNVPRFDHDPITGECKGLLIEEARTNYFESSPGVYGGTISDGTVTGANGLIAKKFVITQGNASYPAIGALTNYIPNNPLSAGQSVDFSFSGYFADIADGLYVPDIVFQASTGGVANFAYSELNVDLTTGQPRTYYNGPDFTEVLDPQVTLMPFGMYKVTRTVRYTQASTIRDTFSFYIQCRKKNTIGGQDGEYYADGVNGFQFSCIQYEVGSVPTSYIPTTTSIGIRMQDIPSIEGTNFKSFFGAPTELSVFYSAIAPYSQGVYWSLRSDNALERISMFYAGLPQVIIYITGGRQAGGYTGAFTSQSNQGEPLYTPSDMKTFALLEPRTFKMISNDGNLNYEFSTTDVQRTPDISTFTILYLGHYNGFSLLNGCIRKFAIYPKRISDNEAQYLTQ